MNSWQTVFTTDKYHQAEIVKNVLSDRDIQAVIINKQDTSYKFGTIEVNVDQNSVLRAIKIIEEEIKWNDE